MKFFSCDNLSGRLFLWVICFISVNTLISPVGAGQWRIDPRLNIRETYTDNVRLSSGGGGDFITQINPGVTLIGEGRRYNANINYMMNNLIYAKQDELSRIRHQLNAFGTAEFIKDRFFVDGRAMMTQQNAFLFQPQAVDNVNPVNRRDIRSYSVSPYVRHRFKDLASAELRYVHGEVDTSGQGFFKSSSDSATARLTSGEAFRIMQWGLSYSHTEIQRKGRGQLRTIELERSIASLRYVVTPRFDLIATGGYERNSFISIDGKDSGATWTAGFAWAPTERTDINLSAGQRFFGDTYFANANHRTRLTLWNVSYIEDVTTFGQQALFGTSMISAGALDPLVGAGNSQALLDQGVPFAFSDPNNFLTNRLFLQKNLQAFVAINGNKNTLMLRGFNMKREALTPAIEDVPLIGGVNAILTSDTEQTGGNISFNHRISPRTSANINYSYIRIDFLRVDRVDNNQMIMFNLNRRFTSNLHGNLSYFYNWRSSDRGNSDFTSNTITASLNMNF